jgi:hypothetical protein
MAERYGFLRRLIVFKIHANQKDALEREHLFLMENNFILLSGKAQKF